MPLLITSILQVNPSWSNAEGAGNDESKKGYLKLGVKEQEERLKLIEDKLGSIKSLRTDFTQKRHMSLFMDVLSSNGILYFQKPDRLRWELTQPYQSIMIFNRGDVAKFQIKDGKLTRLNSGMEDLMRGVLRQILAMMQGDFEKVSQSYNIEVEVGSDYLLSMTPKDEGMSKTITSLELHIDISSLHMRKIIIREPGQDYLEIIFTAHKDDIPLAKDLFNTETVESQ
ncbi:MAG: outer membrane lipoprotein carrier protein LolA [bacterium]|nr:outer membrane lipoprotein carrier protein LolA [bacterium]